MKYIFILIGCMLIFACSSIPWIKANEPDYICYNIGGISRCYEIPEGRDMSPEEDEDEE